MTGCHCGKGGHALNSVNCSVHGTGWQPIETAPRNGTAIWLASPHNMRLGLWLEGGWADFCSCESEGKRDLLFVPTYWQSLPELPTEIDQQFVTAA